MTVLLKRAQEVFFKEINVFGGRGEEASGKAKLASSLTEDKAVTQ